MTRRPDHERDADAGVAMARTWVHDQEGGGELERTAVAAGDEPRAVGTAPGGESPAGVDASESGAIGYEESNPMPKLSAAGFRELVTVPREYYQLGREIARGGMGRIVHAKDLRLDREVVVKELLAPSDALEKRFQREMRITAGLQHPAIISIHEAGRWESGVAFYTMKRVDGRPLSAAIRDAHRLADRLALLRSVVVTCEAIAFAHDRAIIHRDLKPDNVLVGDYGETVVIDWGLAKVLGDADDRWDPADPIDGAGRVAGVDRADASDLTRVGDVMGTPAYMAPEQAQGEQVDARADVYALGAMLYHLLTGQAPYAGARTAEELLDAVIAGPPVPPARLVPELPADLLAIVLRAMSRDPGDRYPTAKQLAAELRRFENGQLVASYSYSPLELFRRWARRHRSAVAIAAAAAIALCSVVGVSVQRIRTQRSIAEMERNEAQAQRLVAEKHQADVEGLLDFMLGDLEVKLEAVGKLDLLEMVALKAADYYQQRGDRAETTDQARRRALALKNLGRVLLAERRVSEAMNLLRTSLAVRERLLAASPGDPLLQRDLATAHEALGDALKQQGDLAGALEHYHRAMELVRAVVRTDPTNVTYRQDLDAVHDDLGEVLVAEGQIDEALKHYDASLAIARRLADEKPEDGKRQLSLSISFEKAGDIRVIQGDLAGALDVYLEASRIREELLRRDPSSGSAKYALSISVEKAGDCHFFMNELESALAAYQHGAALRKALVAFDPDNPKWKSDMGGAYLRLAVVHDRLGHRASRTENAHRCIDVFSELHTDLVVEGAAYNLATCYAFVGDKDHAFQWLAAAARSGYGVDRDRDPDLAVLRSDPRWSKLPAPSRAVTQALPPGVQ